MTGGGENVAPFVKIISHAMLVGDQRKHLAVVITLKTVLHMTGWRRATVARRPRGGGEEDNEDVGIDIMNRIKKVNKSATSNAEEVHKFMIAP